MTVKRQICTRCQRPLTTCFCHLTININTQTQVIIWQHPNEQNHPKGTAKLLNLCLSNSKIILGEVLSPKELGVDVGNCLLLYPEDKQTELAPNQQEPSNSPKQLLVIDGTWRKSRKIIYSNPWLSTLPRLAIQPDIGEYRIRKAEAGHQLSTFESVSVGLKKLEPSNTEINELKGVFNKFIRQYEIFLPCKNQP